MNDAVVGDLQIFHAGGGTHSSKKTCAICQEEARTFRRAKLTEVERLGEDMVEEALRAIRKGELDEYIHRIAVRLHKAEILAAATKEQLEAAHLQGFLDAKDRMGQALEEI